MTSDWREVRIQDLAEKVAMGPFGSSIKVSTFVDAGVPVISGHHLHGIRLSDENFKFITEEHAERLKNSNVYPGTSFSPMRERSARSPSSRRTPGTSVTSSRSASSA